MQGIVEHGDARGRQLGFPTANLPLHGSDELDGVWAAHAVVDGVGRFGATVSIGRRPTYYRDGARLAEVHLLDFAGDIYGSHLSVELVSFLRPQVRCGSEAELIAMITADVHTARAVVNAESPTYHWPWLGLVPA